MESSSTLQKFGVWVRELRAPFFTASVVPTLLGGLIGWHHGFFNPLFFLLAIFGTVCINAGINMLNDYFDFKSGIDIRTTPTPFSGGSRMLPGGILQPRSVYLAGLLALGLASVIGVYLIFMVGWVILVLGVVGLLSAYFYSTEIAKTGFGELTVGVNLGPLAVLGAYYVQAHELTWEPVVASVPVGILVATILYINEFPDYDADKLAGRYNLVVRLGRRKAVTGYVTLLTATYLSLSVAVAFGVIPLTCLLALLTVPLAVKAIGVARRHYDDIQNLIPANALTIQVHLLTGLLMSIGYVVDRLVFIA